MKARVVIRLEGEYWIGYYAPPDSFEGAVVLGAIHRGAVSRHQHRRTDWINLLKHLAVEVTRDLEGEHVGWFDVEVVEGKAACPRSQTPSGRGASHD